MLGKTNKLERLESNSRRIQGKVQTNSEKLAKIDSEWHDPLKQEVGKAEERLANTFEQIIDEKVNAANTQNRNLKIKIKKIK